jgi:hypothetical protein
MATLDFVKRDGRALVMTARSSPSRRSSPNREPPMHNIMAAAESAPGPQSASAWAPSRSAAPSARGRMVIRTDMGMGITRRQRTTTPRVAVGTRIMGATTPAESV